MASDHLRRPHTWGFDAECPACRERCHCPDTFEPPCVYCRLNDVETRTDREIRR